MSEASGACQPHYSQLTANSMWDNAHFVRCLGGEGANQTRTHVYPRMISTDPYSGRVRSSVGLLLLSYPFEEMILLLRAIQVIYQWVLIAAFRAKVLAPLAQNAAHSSSTELHM